MFADGLEAGCEQTREPQELVAAQTGEPGAAGKSVLRWQRNQGVVLAA